jgi:hypothetical protein
MSFHGVLKKNLLKIHVLAYGFIEISQSAVKTDRNSVFLGRDPHIPGR